MIFYINAWQCFYFLNTIKQMTMIKCQSRDVHMGKLMIDKFLIVNLDANMLKFTYD